VVDTSYTKINTDAPVRPSSEQGTAQGWTGFERMEKHSATLGWRPSCGHTEAIERPDPALVLDPFAGTGTTCAAAQRLGRRAVGVDISEAYLEQAVRRLSAVTLPMLNF
jgi:SAM-dependent methyltransferase